MPEENNWSRQAIERLGVDPNELGCVMLGVELPDVYRMVLEPEWAYYSKKYDYVKGYEGDAHITLLYGLMLSAATPKGRAEVDGVLEGWIEPNVVVFPEVEVFPGNDGDNDYSCLVLSLGENLWDRERLDDANGRLRKLPHVDGFAKYNPHITIGYVQKEFTNMARELLERVEVRPLRTTVLDYGD